MKKLRKLIPGFIRGWIEGISNIVKWAPIIYKDRDYDEFYLYKILHKKLDNMERFFRSEYSHILRHNEVADEIKEVKDLIYNVMNDIYSTEVHERINTSDFINFDGGRFNCDSDHPKYKEWDEGLLDAENKRQEAKQRAFSLISRNIDAWWD